METALARACAGALLIPSLRYFWLEQMVLLWQTCGLALRCTAYSIIPSRRRHRASPAQQSGLLLIDACTSEVCSMQGCLAPRRWRPGLAIRTAVPSWRMAAPTQPLLTGAQTAQASLAHPPLCWAPASASCPSSPAFERSCSCGTLPAHSCPTSPACQQSAVREPVQVLPHLGPLSIALRPAAANRLPLRKHRTARPCLSTSRTIASP